MYPQESGVIPNIALRYRACVWCMELLFELLQCSGVVDSSAATENYLFFS